VRDDLEFLRESLKGRFEIERELGRGMYGSVFTATDANERRVALKVLRPEVVVAVNHRRVLRELGIISRLSHPHVLPVLESGMAGDLLFYSMPYLPGPSLADRLDRGGPLGLAAAHRIASEVSEALEYAHQHGVVHRDVAPRHILFDGGRAVVKEFWIARALSNSRSEHLTSSGMVLGTPGYMSPEQMLGAKVDQRSDVYSLAVLIVRMLTNDVPFKGGTTMQAISRQLKADGLSVSELPKGLNAAIARSVVKALAADPDKRFASARELVEACFDEMSDTRELVVARLSRSGAGGPENLPAGPKFTREAPVTAAAPQARPRMRALPIVIAAALVLLAIGGNLGWRAQSRPMLYALASLSAALLLGSFVWYRSAQRVPIQDALNDDDRAFVVSDGAWPAQAGAHAPRVLPIDRLRAALRFRYDIQREVGRGGMAEVYMAKDLRYRGRIVALKLLRAEYAASSTSERFLEEIEINARLSHPGILPLLDSGDADGRPFFVMPYVEGQTLRSRIQDETRLAVGDAITIAREVARALEYAHRCQVVHRDIKPENILLHEGQATVMDFGIALALDRARDRRLTAGLSIGTPEYMSPEQFWDTQNIDHRSDIYSLGCVLHEMLAGVPPYSGTAMELSIKHRDAPIPSIREVRPETPEGIEAVLFKCLAKERKGRFDTAATLVAALPTPGVPTPPNMASRSVSA
jgi:serine/threonine protein kinase